MSWALVNIWKPLFLILKSGTGKLVLHLKWLKHLTATLLTLVMTWQETCLPLILFRKAILSQLAPLSHAIHTVFHKPFLFFLPRPMLKFPWWGYLIPFIALSVDGVFRGCFARVFTFLLVLLLFIHFISFACSESLVSAHSRFLLFPCYYFLVSVFLQAFWEVIFVRVMLSPGPCSSFGLTEKLKPNCSGPASHALDSIQGSFSDIRPDIRSSARFLGTPTTLITADTRRDSLPTPPLRSNPWRSQLERDEILSYLKFGVDICHFFLSFKGDL